MTDPYVGPGGVLWNIPCLTDPRDLEVYERRMALVRVAEVELRPVPGSFNLDQLRNIHHHTLHDVYEWVGMLRTTDTSAMGMAHCRPEHLAEQGGVHLPPDTSEPPLPGRPRARRGHRRGPPGRAGCCTRSGTATPGHSAYSSTRCSARQVDWRAVDADALHAARHVAMATADHGYLARVLEPGVFKHGEVPPGTLSGTQGLRSASSSGAIYRAMLEHRRSSSSETFEV